MKKSISGGNECMNHAVIDLGSNSIRLAVYDCDNDHVHKIFGEKEVAGLAGYVSDGRLDDIGIVKACNILNGFKALAEPYVDPANIFLFATASLRNIQNRAEAVAIISELTSLTPDIIDGDEEAALGFAGASRYFDCNDGIMIDIGGASTELVLFRDGQPVNLTSLPIGCLNLCAKYVSEIIPNKQERKRIKEDIAGQFAKIDWTPYENLPVMVGIGGTLRATLRLSHALFGTEESNDTIPSSRVKDIIRLMVNNEDQIYFKVFKAIPERLMTITTGLYILQRAIATFGSESISVSNYGVREGYLIEKVLNWDDRYNITSGIIED